MQQALFPIQLINEEPANLGTADLKLVGWDDQDRKYAIKTVEDHPLLPITEWLCHHLCLACSIPTPEFSVVKRLDGSEAFGSRWAMDAIEINPASTPKLQAEALLRGAAPSMSAALMMAAFIADEDRRIGNFLYRQTTARVIALAFDWSRAPVLYPPAFSHWPWSKNCNSAVTSAYMKAQGLLAADEIRRVSQSLKNVSIDMLKVIVDSAPVSWSHTLDVSLILDWWSHHSVQRTEDAEALILT